MKKILSIIIMLTIILTMYIVPAYAYVINGVDVPEQFLEQIKNRSYNAMFETTDRIYLTSANSYFNLKPGALSYNRNHMYMLASSGSDSPSSWLVLYQDKSTGIIQQYTTSSTGYGVQLFEKAIDINMLLASYNLDYYDADTNSTNSFPNNFSPNLKITHGDRFTFTNVGIGPVEPNINFTKSSMTDAITLVMTDAYGKFVEQQNIGINKATFTIKVMPGETRNVYFSFDDELHRLDKDNHYIEFKFLNQTYIQWEKYIPKFRISGGTTVNLKGIEIPNEVPYIKPNSSTEIIYRYDDNGNTVYKAEQISPNEKFNFNVNTEYIIKFIHEPTTTIYVESNFTLQDTTERISLESDENLKEQIISNGGSLIEESALDHKYQLNNYKDMKISNLKSKNALGIGEVIQAYVMGSANSNLKIHGYGFNDDAVYKKFEYYLDSNNQGKPYAISISPEEFIVLEENTGTSLVTIRAKFIEDTDFTIEYYPEYPFDEAIETTYSASNPSPPNVGDVDDMWVEPVADNLWDSITTGNTPDFTGLNPETSELTLAIGQISGIKSFTEIFIQPVTYLFTGVPELYAIIVFALGLSVVKFVLGR